MNYTHIVMSSESKYECPARVGGNVLRALQGTNLYLRFCFFGFTADLIPDAYVAVLKTVLTGLVT